MQQILYDSYLDYLKTKGINKVESFDVNKQKNTSLTEREVEKHLKLISTFHDKASNFDGFMRSRINNNTGKVVEEFKVQIRKLKKDLINIDKKEHKDDFEELILKYGEANLSRAEQCIDNIYDWGYIDIITRSMRRTEVCLEDVGADNIRDNNGIEIINFADCEYNMVEVDAFYFLGKLKRKGLKLDWYKLSYKFCEFEGLGINSEKFILSLMSYPYEFMKCCDKYREEKNKLLENKKIKIKDLYAVNCDDDFKLFIKNCNKKLQKAMKQDSEFLI